MTMREWLEARVAKGQRLLVDNGDVHGTRSAADTLTWLKLRPQTAVELEQEVEEVTAREKYAEYGYIGHIGRTQHLCFTYLTDAEEEPQ